MSKKKLHLSIDMEKSGVYLVSMGVMGKHVMVLNRAEIEQPHARSTAIESVEEIEPEAMFEIVQAQECQVVIGAGLEGLCASVSVEDTH